MKRSQLLRDSVDLHLSVEAQSYGDMSPFICNCISEHVERKLKMMGEADLLREIVEIFMKDTGSLSTTAYGAAVHICPGFLFEKTFPSAESFQGFRYMFADFVAYFLESSGFDEVGSPLPSEFTNAI